MEPINNSDYLSGKFIDFNWKEIDTYAIMVLDEHQKQHEIVENSKCNWFFGGRKQNPVFT